MRSCSDSCLTRLYNTQACQQSQVAQLKKVAPDLWLEQPDVQADRILKRRACALRRAPAHANPVLQREVDRLRTVEALADAQCTQRDGQHRRCKVQLSSSVDAAEADRHIGATRAHYGAYGAQSCSLLPSFYSRFDGSDLSIVIKTLIRT